MFINFQSSPDLTTRNHSQYMVHVSNSLYSNTPVFWNFPPQHSATECKGLPTPQKFIVLGWILRSSFGKISVVQLKSCQVECWYCRNCFSQSQLDWIIRWCRFLRNSKTREAAYMGTFHHVSLLSKDHWPGLSHRDGRALTGDIACIMWKPRVVLESESEVLNGYPDV